MSSAELQQLLQALEERSTELTKDDVAWAFDSAKTRDEIASWVRQYLNPACILTIEEEAFHLGEHGASKEAQTFHPISDHSFEDAISSLEASTISIERQCRTIEAQKRALQGLKQQSSSTKDSSVPKAQQQDGRVSRERSRLDFDCNELSDTLQAQFRAAIKHSESSSSGARPSVERLLEKDDRLLDGLEKILPQLLEADDDSHAAEEAERLCQALKTFTSAEVRPRIDAAFIDGAQTYTEHANGVNGRAAKQSQQLKSLNAELDELCREIDGLSAMAVDNQYSGPLVHAAQAAKLESDGQRLAWAEYMSSALHHIRSRIEYLHEHHEDQQAHTAAVKSMSAALDEILAAHAGKSEEAPHNPRSPSKITQKGLKPLRLVQANLSDPQDPTSQLLRQFDVRVSGDVTALALSKMIADKDAQLSSLLESSERSMSDQIAQSLSEADTDVDQLLRSVFAHSQYGSTHVESEELRKGVSGLKVKTQELSEKMRNMDLEGMTKTVRTKQQHLLTQLGKQ